MDGVGTAIVVDMFYEDKNKVDPSTSMQIHTITFSNITAVHSGSPGYFQCQPSAPCFNLSMVDVRVEAGSATSDFSFRCASAFGESDSVSPASCFQHAPSGCDVDACFSRCVQKYGGSIETGAYSCAKGCASMSNGKVVDKDKLCKYSSGPERYSACVRGCADAGKSTKTLQQCQYGCVYWL